MTTSNNTPNFEALLSRSGRDFPEMQKSSMFLNKELLKEKWNELVSFGLEEPPF